MDPNQPTAGRARGRGRGLYVHPPPVHVKDSTQYPKGEPYDPYTEQAKQRAKAPASVIQSKHSSSEEGTKAGRGAPKKVGTITGGDPTKRIVYPEARPVEENVRGKLPRRLPESLIYTRPKDIVSKGGVTGQKITCEANYFRLDKKPNWNIYQYRVDFQPNVEDMRSRRKIVSSQRPMLGGYLFEGTQIFITKMLESETVARTVQLDDQTEYTVTFRLTRMVAMHENQSLQILNLILRRAMDGLRLETVGRNKFDPDAAIQVPNLRLQIWPGYITSIRQHEQDILVCAEISHKIMRNETVYQIIKKIRTESRDFKNQVLQTLLGATVLTRYNNKTYRIDEVTFDRSPMDTFKMGERDVTYVEYYKTKYKLDISDRNQPMLVSNLKKKDMRGGQDQEVLLVPELCYATGLTDEMRANFRTMKELSQHTKIGPASRIERLLQFNQRLANSQESSRHLTEWNLALHGELVKIPARVLPYPDILFGNDKKSKTNNRADWQSEFRNNAMFKCIDLKRWYVITPSRAREETANFIQALQRAGRGMQFNVGQPRVVELPQDSQTAISEQINRCANENPQMIMCVVSNNQGDRYTTIKKRCYIDFGLPSQVIVHKTITPKDKTKGISGLLSVATKVAIQMNAKLGGLPWMISMPVSGLMTFGYDVCHDPTDKSKSWGALVATMDLKQCNSEFFTALNSHRNGEELSNHMSENVAKALNQFEQINGVLPERIMFFRDGVGEGQIEYVHQNEVVAIKAALQRVYESRGRSEVQFLYMIVTKRVNTRIFFDRRNPEPGTCVDDVITFPERYDFYLVSQTVREGTVTPTGFNIIHDTMGIPPDRIQQLTFRFTYFYYNWSGTVRVPALCQYAHKLAFLASQSMRQAPTNQNTSNLTKTLYFL